MAVPIFVINLERSAERRERAVAAYRAIGVEIQLTPAIDGRARDMTVDPAYDRRARLARYGVDLNSTEIACYLSHLDAIRRAYESGASRAIVVEDDVHPALYFNEALDRLSAAPEQFEFVRLIGTRPRRSLPVARLSSNVRIVWPTHGLCGAQGYYLTRIAMEKILAAASMVTLPFDVMLDRYWRTNLTIFALDPYVVRNAPGQSDIGARPDAWARKPRPLLRARLKAGKLWERGERIVANASRRTRLAQWRRLGAAAFEAVGK